jgi:hypothetical protein
MGYIRYEKNGKLFQVNCSFWTPKTASSIETPITNYKATRRQFPGGCNFRTTLWIHRKTQQSSWLLRFTNAHTPWQNKIFENIKGWEHHFVWFTAKKQETPTEDRMLGWPTALPARRHPFSPHLHLFINHNQLHSTLHKKTNCKSALMFNPLTPELNPSANAARRDFYWKFCFLSRAFR